MRRETLALAALGALGMAAACLSGCGTLPGKPRPEDREIAPRDIEDFLPLYAENCAGCHGAEGKGSAGFPLSNPVYLAITDDDDLRRVISRGVPGTMMSAFARAEGGMLTARQVDALVKGLRAWARPEVLAGGAPPPRTSDAPGDVARGGDVYAAYCASCHGPEGRGTPRGSSIVDGSYLALVSDQHLRSLVIAGWPGIGQPDWRSAAPGRAMTAEEVTNVVAWLSARRPALPGQPYPTD